MTTKLFVNITLFIFIILSGFWMAKIGKPYNPLAFNIHKFVSLTFIVYTIVLSRGLTKSIEMNSIHWIFLILSVFFLLILLVSGGIMSAKEEIIKPMVFIHKLSSGLALISITGWFYLSLR